MLVAPPALVVSGFIHTNGRYISAATAGLNVNLFENLVVAETLIHRLNRGNRSNLPSFRDSRGLEFDLFK